MKLIAVPLFFVCAMACPAEDLPQTFTTTEGRTYMQAVLTELRPTGVVFSTASGVVVVPYAQLPKDLQSRYVTDSVELAKAVGNSLDGSYEMKRERTGFGGERISLSGVNFVHEWGNDAGDFGVSRGGFTVKDGWITFHDPKGPVRHRVLAVIQGKLALLAPSDFKVWCESRSVDRLISAVLYRNPPER